MIIRTVILWEMAKLVWNEFSELSEEVPVSACSVEVNCCVSKALTVPSWIILHCRVLNNKLKSTRQAICVSRNIEARSCNQCCSGKAISIAYGECVWP
jgi:hypothetical protein